MYRHLIPMMIAVVVFALGLVACSDESSLTPFLADTAGSATTQFTDSADMDTSDDSAEPEAEPEWFRLGASLTLIEGLATVVTLELDFYDGDQALIEYCSETREVTSIVGSVETPDPSIFHWWRMSVDDLAGPCVLPGELPTELHLGLGQLHPEVDARLIGLGLDGVADSLYGAYALLDDAQLELDTVDQVALAYGFAGTESDFAGDSLAQASAPLPNGDYQLSGVFLFPLTSVD